MALSSPLNRSRVTSDDSSLSASGSNSVSARDSKYWLSLVSSNGSFISSGSINGSSTNSSTTTVPSVTSLFDLRSSVLVRGNGLSSPSSSTQIGEKKNAHPSSPVSSSSSSSPPPPTCIIKEVADEEEEGTTVSTSKNKLFSQRIVKEEVCEHQRYQIVLGWGSKGHLLPLDPGKYTRRVVRKPKRKSIRSTSSSWSRSGGGGGGGGGHGSENGDSLSLEEQLNEQLGLQQDMEVIHSPTFPDISLPIVPTTINTTSGGTTSGCNDVILMTSSSASASSSSCTSTTIETGKWEWISPWHLECPPPTTTTTKKTTTTSSSSSSCVSTVVDAPEDPDGWQYASSFHHFDLGNPQLTSWTPKPKFYVRRRKWIRYRRFVPQPPPPVPPPLVQSQSQRQSQSQAPLPSVAAHCQAFDDCFLDSMCGWLKKMGHVRKNWKKRFFVLEKSILRYFTDETRSKLKGEVLLFHPATKVHYVDIRVSEKENTFMIEVGQQYHLLLEASSLVERENWMYCIEDALLCRDSYRQFLFYELQNQKKKKKKKEEEEEEKEEEEEEMLSGDTNATLNLQIVARILENLQDCRESVARRRSMSSQATLMEGGRTSTGGLNWSLNPLNVFFFSSNETREQKKKKIRLLLECESLLQSDQIKQRIQSFIQKFTQKFPPIGTTGTSGSTSSRNTSNTRNTSSTSSTSSTSTTAAVLPTKTRRTSFTGNSITSITSPTDTGTHTGLNDTRSTLAFKAYRYFIERTLAEAMASLSRLECFTSPLYSPITTPKNNNNNNNNNNKKNDDDDDDDVLTQYPSFSSNDKNDDWELIKKAALYKIERQTFLPLQGLIYHLLENSINDSKKTIHQFECHRLFLAQKSQHFFDIDPRHESKSEWKEAIELFNTMDNYSLPSEKASILLEVAKCIYTTFSKEHCVLNSSPTSQLENETHLLLSADDFLPIFIFIICQSDVRNLILSRLLISETMISVVMMGETGYYTTMFEAAVEYIASFVHPELDQMVCTTSRIHNRSTRAREKGGERRSLTRLSRQSFY